MQTGIFLLFLNILVPSSQASTPEITWRVPDRSLIQHCVDQSISFTQYGRLSYVSLRIGSLNQATPAWFLLDTGSTQSSLDAKLFPTEPSFFDFFGPWAHTHFLPNDFSQLQTPVPQAGILGTDFFSQRPHLFDFDQSILSRSDDQLHCSDEDLHQAGMTALSTRGYFTRDPSQLLRIHDLPAPNVPTVPIKIGSVTFPAQIDSGYNDNHYAYSVNINAALKKKLDEAGVQLLPMPRLNSSLSTCVDQVKDQLTAYQLPRNTFFTFLNTDGKEINRYHRITIFLKTTPPEAWKCGGISTLPIPAAQLGASFMIQMGLVIYDPIQSKVWIPQPQEP